MMSVPRRTWAMASRSSRSMMPPVGLQGKGSTRALVRGVMADRSWSGVSRNSSSALVSTKTGTPPAMLVSGP